jgi:hypothetical protein
MKELLTLATVSKDALHIYAAVAVQIGAAAAFRRSVASFVPWACVLGAALLNEGLDTFAGGERYLQAWQVRGAAHDLINSMLLPTVLLLLCRRAPQLFGHIAASPPKHDD